MNETTKQVVRWTLALTQMSARLGERKYVSEDAKRLLFTTDQMLAEMLSALGLNGRPLASIDDDQDNFDKYSERVAS